VTAADLALLRAGLVVTADVLTVFANWPYIQAVRARVLPARPRLVTWLVFAAATAVPAAGSFRTGDWTDGAFLAALSAGCLGVLVTGWRYGSRHVGWFGSVCLALGAAGVGALAVSVVRPAAVTATQVLVLSVMTDFVAFLPTYHHGWYAPHEEPPRPWALFAVGSALTLAASAPGSADALLWPAYLLAADGFMLFLVLVARERDRRSSRGQRCGQVGYRPLACTTQAAGAALGEARDIAGQLRCQPLLDRAADLTPTGPAVPTRRA
jgi:hypothetical protein